jgi:hypothetical protein
VTSRGPGSLNAISRASPARFARDAATRRVFYIIGGSSVEEVAMVQVAMQKKENASPRWRTLYEYSPNLQISNFMTFIQILKLELLGFVWRLCKLRREPARVWHEGRGGTLYFGPTQSTCAKETAQIDPSCPSQRQRHTRGSTVRSENNKTTLGW